MAACHFTGGRPHAIALSPLARGHGTGWETWFEAGCGRSRACDRPRVGKTSQPISGAWPYVIYQNTNPTTSSGSCFSASGLRALWGTCIQTRCHDRIRRWTYTTPTKQALQRCGTPLGPSIFSGAASSSSDIKQHVDM